MGDIPQLAKNEKSITSDEPIHVGWVFHVKQLSMSKWERKIGTSTDANQILVVGKTLEVENVFKPNGRQGVGIALYGYNLEDLIGCMLEDYGEEKILETIKKVNN